MSLEKCSEIQRTAPPGRLLETLTKEYKRQEDAKAKPAASAAQRPAPAKATPAAPARPAAPAAPAAVMPSAAAIATAMLDEQERRDKAALVKTRAEFSALSPKEQSAFCRNGGKLTD